ncbi:hypothetical protein FPRO06_11822 [Fusarium proliferatum]|nr:hypothetical protein FPRO06_11822 [Fusarium proliferatum]
MDKEEKSTSTTTSNEPPGHDIFCTPENSEFLSKVHYKDLNEGDREIRLLKILPNSGSGFIECELLPSVKLADMHKQYLALSYCAGDAHNTKPITVNGARCNVFANLHHALKTVRHYWKTHTYHRDLLLWVDQICINQANLAERSHQVGFMRAIYESASETLICLSVAETRGDGMRWLVQLERFIGEDLFLDAMFPPEYQRRSRGPEANFSFQLKMRQCMSLPEFVDGWIEFCKVLTSPWWGRAWVFQEFMVSSRATFLYGLHSVGYPDMLRLICDLCLATLEILLEPNKYRGTYVKKRLKRAQATRAQISHSISKVLSVFLAKKECKFVAHYIKVGYADASFVQVPHPVHSELETTALQVWAVFLDSGFDIGHQKIFAGKNNFLFGARFPVQQDHELWVLCGSSEPFLLRRYSGGYRIVGPVLCYNLTTQPLMPPTSGDLSKCTDESGDLDPSKMERKRITIF